MKEITTALIKSQKEIKNAMKDATNPHLKNKYATLESVIEAVKDIANNHGMAVIQLNGRDDKGDFVETMILHESGESITSRCYLLVNKNDMQGLGSAITYARRYSLASIFCITQEDDDGNGSKRPIPKNEDLKKPAQNGLGDYVIPIGTKYRGKMLKEVAKADLNGFVVWLESDAHAKNKDLDGPAVEFVNKAKAYISGASA